tara:strand:- start:318 stop:581 length:264 start_codon:yes stop_codon:yes gene_type:complete
MKVKELMELTGETRFNFVKVLINDALNEIQLRTKENITQYTTDLVNGQSSYNLPSNLVQVTNVKIKNPKSEYFEPLNRIILEDYKEK